MLVYFKSAATINDLDIIFRASKEGIDDIKKEYERLRELYNDDWVKVNEGLKIMYASWDKDDERKPLTRFTKVDEKGPYRDDGNISWPGGGGPKYSVIHPITGKPCKIPEAGWRFPTPERMQEEIDNGRVVFGVDETTLPRIRRNLFESDKQVMRSVTFSYAQTATLDFIKIFDNVRVFENPKSVSDIKKLIEYITSADDNDIILDFFSGSATTAHAVMQLNAEDGGNRKFICVQIPELCGEKSEAYKAGYKNICEIGKERIRRAGLNLMQHITSGAGNSKGEGWGCGMPTTKDEWDYAIQNILDVGFKVFKLDTSNLKTWDNSLVAEDDMQILLDRMNNMIHRVKSDRSDMDMVCEIMLKLGVPLDCSVEKIEFNGKTAYTVGKDCLLLICIAENVQPEDVETMAEYAPAKVIIARDSFADDTAMSNAHYILRDRGIELKLV